MIIRLLFAFIVLLCTAGTVEADSPSCENSQFLIEADFESGNFAKCKFKSTGSVEITIRPEDHKVVVEQPWFAFRITAREPGELQIRLRFPDAYARYWPKLSSDGIAWTRATESSVDVSRSKKNMSLTVSVGNSPVWVAAQELLSIGWYDDWLAELAGHDDFTTAVIGQSVEGRSIRIARNANKPEAIILLGRQHPAEVPGALAMRDFVDVLLADTDLARRFRERFTLLIIPLMNPDGVANGHWRHNAGRTDLNRDWGIFKQPETQAVAKLLGDVETLEMKPRLMLDFHATKFTETLMFYTQTSAEVTDPPGFAVNWFAAVRTRLPDFEFRHDPRPSSENPNTKGFFYRRYGIPAYTYELGDEADRELLHATTPIFAEEMMRELLETTAP